MRFCKLPIVSVAVGAALILASMYWYQWSARPLTSEEINRYIAAIEAQTQNPGGRHDLTVVRDLLEHDNGKPVFTVNLYSFKDIAEYPEGSDFSGTGEEAFARFQRAMVRLTPKRAAHPVFSSNWAHDQTNSWDKIVIMRHRSRRDLVDMFASDEFADASMHKWASIDKHDRSVVEAIQLPDGRIFIILFGVLAGLATYSSGRALSFLKQRKERAA